MTPKVREAIYIVAFVLAIACFALVTFGIVTPTQIGAGLGVLALVFAGVSGLAYMNVNK